MSNKEDKKNKTVNQNRKITSYSKISKSRIDSLLSCLYLNKYGEVLFFLRKIFPKDSLREFIKLFENETIKVPSYEEFEKFELELLIIQKILLSSNGKISDTAIRKISKSYSLSEDAVSTLIKDVYVRFKDLQHRVLE